MCFQHELKLQLHATGFWTLQSYEALWSIIKFKDHTDHADHRELADHPSFLVVYVFLQFDASSYPRYPPSQIQYCFGHRGIWREFYTCFGRLHLIQSWSTSPVCLCFTCTILYLWLTTLILRWTRLCSSCATQASEIGWISSCGKKPLLLKPSWSETSIILDRFWVVLVFVPMHVRKQ